MIFAKAYSNGLSAMKLRGRHGARSLWLGVIVLVAVAAAWTFPGGATRAAAQMAAGLEVLERYAAAEELNTEDLSIEAGTPGLWAAGTDAMSVSWPAIPTYQDGSDDLTLQVGQDLFAASDAEVLGVKRSVYHCYLDEGLGRAADGNAAVSLILVGEGE